jgi:hypothetical protein
MKAPADQLLTLKQLEHAIPLRSFHYPRLHPSIIAAAIAAGQLETSKKLPRGRPHDHRIDEACARWDKGLRDVDDYVDLLTPNTNEEIRAGNFRSLKSAINKRLRAGILAAEAKNLAKPRSA